MHGLPVGVHIVSRRLEEEKVLEGMKVMEALLEREGIAYAHMSVKTYRSRSNRENIPGFRVPWFERCSG
jgi:hypothetical protein